MGTLTKNFNWYEVSSQKAQTLPQNIRDNAKALANTILQPARDLLGLPMNITSWYRDPVHNKAIGGASNSQHLYGTAADLYVSSLTGLQLFDFFVKNYSLKLGGIGLYYNENNKGCFIHVDIRQRVNNSLTAWYQDSNGAYVSPNKAMINIFDKYGIKWVG